jgi:four helix bundle protein
VPQFDLKDRTRSFALAIVALVEDFPQSRSADAIGHQLLRSGTSVGANYRAACRARSTKEFLAKMGIVEEEADESQFWLDLVIARGFADTDRGLLDKNGASNSPFDSAFRIPNSALDVH